MKGEGNSDQETTDWGRRGEKLPPAVKAKSGDAPSGPSSSVTSVKDKELCLSCKRPAILPFLVSLTTVLHIKDLNEHRVSVPVSQQLKTSLTQARKPTLELANALLRSFFHTRKGVNDESLFELFSYPTAEPKGWFRFFSQSAQPSCGPRRGAGLSWNSLGVPALSCSLRAPAAFVGCDRGNSTLREQARSLSPPPRQAEGYAPLIRYGAKHVFIKSMC